MCRLRLEAEVAARNDIHMATAEHRQELTKDRVQVEATYAY